MMISPGDSSRIDRRQKRLLRQPDIYSVFGQLRGLEVELEEAEANHLLGRRTQPLRTSRTGEEQILAPVMVRVHERFSILCRVGTRSPNSLQQQGLHGDKQIAPRALLSIVPVQQTRATSLARTRLEKEKHHESNPKEFSSSQSSRTAGCGRGSSAAAWHFLPPYAFLFCQQVPTQPAEGSTHRACTP